MIFRFFALFPGVFLRKRGTQSCSLGGRAACVPPTIHRPKRIEVLFTFYFLHPTPLDNPKHLDPVEAEVGPWSNGYWAGVRVLLFSAFRWCSMVFGRFRCFSVVFDGFRWCSMVLGGFQSFLMVLGGVH